MPALSEAFTAAVEAAEVPPAAESHTRSVREEIPESEAPSTHGETKRAAAEHAVTDRTETARIAVTTVEMATATIEAARAPVEPKPEPIVEAKKPVVEEKKPIVEEKPVVEEAKAAKVVEKKVEAAQEKSAKDEELDPSGISAEFFRAEEDSLPPMIEPADMDERPLPVVLSPAAMARRARFRRVVAGVVGFAAVLSLAVAGKAIAGAGKSNVTPPKVATVVETVTEAQKPAAAATVEQVALATKPEAKVEEKTAEAPKAEDKKADDAKTADAKVDEKKADEPKAADPSFDAVAAKKKALSLLNQGKDKDAIELCKQGIESAPDEGAFYLYLGTALQDLGKIKDAREAYNECVKNGKKGSTFECVQMGGHK